MNKNLLKVENLTMKFGGLTAIDNLSFSANNNEITSIIGPNGAGKTTVFNCLTGFYKPTAGEMLLNKNDEIVALKKFTDYKIAQKAKVARTFQNIRLFPAMSVLENLLVAQHNELMVASGYSIFGILNLKRYKDKEREAVEKAKYWLDIIGLTNRADDNAGDLPYGDQRKLEIIRAMCTNPKLLCLDEPAAGLNPKESSELNKLFPENNLIELSNNHPIFNGKYKFKDGLPKIHEHDAKPAQGFGLFYEGRLICFYDFESDLSDGWEDEVVHNNPPEVRIKALQMGANIIAYAFKN